MSGAPGAVQECDFGVLAVELLDDEDFEAGRLMERVLDRTEADGEVLVASGPASSVPYTDSYIQFTSECTVSMRC